MRDKGCWESPRGHRGQQQGDMKLTGSPEYFGSTTSLGLDNYSLQKVLFLFSEAKAQTKLI